MSKRPFFSIVMPTYNSSDTIEKTLSSLKNQTIFPSEVELLVIDGGSDDDTVEIAKRYGAKIINNPDRVPEAAKLIGFNTATGCYVIEMDSDEILISNNQLENRKNALIENPDIYVLISSRLSPVTNNGFYSAYSTLLGDPFSFFIYRNFGDFSKTYKSNIVSADGASVLLFHFARTDKIPIADGGTTTISLDYIKNHFDNRMNDPSFAATAASEIIKETGKMICLSDDTVIHNNQLSRDSYLKKLNFRIINNIFEPEKSGYSSRTKDSGKQRIKKYLFLLYCVFLLPVFIDSVFLCFKFKNIRYLEHILLSFYVLFLIAFYMMLKLLGYKKSVSSYGK